MAILSKKVKKILKFASIGALLAVAAMGVIIKENKNDSSVSSSRALNYGVAGEEQGVKEEEAEQPKMVCRDMLSEDENSLAFREYTKEQIVDCSSVGCGGIF